jgi:histidinol-phosphate aminotransferase
MADVPTAIWQSFGNQMAFSRRWFCQIFGIAAGVHMANALSIGSDFGEVGPAQDDGFIRLDRNENAYGPPPRVIDAIRRAATQASRYPRSQSEELKNAIAHLHRIDRERVLLGPGSCDLLRLAAHAFLGRERPIVVADPTFGASEHYAARIGAPVIKVPLTRELDHDLDTMRTRCRDNGRGLVYICNPNNPTGTLTSWKEIEKFVASLPASTVVVVDEAYHEYAGVSGMYASLIDKTAVSDRLVVLRTFSIAYGLAGLRVGYAVGTPKTLDAMRAFATEDNVNTIAASAALAALESADVIREYVRRNDDDRQDFFNRATERMLKPIDSHANFAFMNMFNPAADVIQHFRQHGILVGPQFSSMSTHIRISFGTPDEMTEFWRVADLLPMHDVAM